MQRNVSLRARGASIGRTSVKKNIKRAAAGGLAALLASAALSACGDAPEKNSSNAAKTDFLPCIVSDAGGFDDKSFNQLSYEGVKEAAAKLGSDFKGVESHSEN